MEVYPPPTPYQICKIEELRKVSVSERTDDRKMHLYCTGHVGTMAPFFSAHRGDSAVNPDTFSLPTEL